MTRMPLIIIALTLVFSTDVTQAQSRPPFVLAKSPDILTTPDSRTIILGKTGQIKSKAQPERLESQLQYNWKQDVHNIFVDLMQKRKRMLYIPEIVNCRNSLIVITREGKIGCRHIHDWLKKMKRELPPEKIQRRMMLNQGLSELRAKNVDEYIRSTLVGKLADAKISQTVFILSENGKQAILNQNQKAEYEIFSQIEGRGEQKPSNEIAKNNQKLSKIAVNIDGWMN